MSKPTPKTRKPIMDFHEMMSFVEKKYGFSYHDYKGTRNLHIPFEKETGINVYKCPDVSGSPKTAEYKGWTIYEGGLIKGIQRRKATEEEYKEQFKEYYANCGKFTEWKKKHGYDKLEYLNYWHWLLGYCFHEVSTLGYRHHPCDLSSYGCDAYFPIKEILEDNKPPKWVKEITQKIYDEFKKNLDKDGGIEVHIEW